MNLRWKFKTNGDVVSITVNDITPPVKIPLDDVLDKSNYVPFAETARKSVISGSGLGKVGVYDDDSVLPSNEFVKFRSGKLDKAEVSDYINSHSEAISKAEKEAMINASSSSDNTSKEPVSKEITSKNVD